MNPETNRLEPVSSALDQLQSDFESVRRPFTHREALAKAVKKFSPLVRADGTPVPKDWSIFSVGEDVIIKNYTFRVAYIGETAILLEPVGVPIIGEAGDPKGVKA